MIGGCWSGLERALAHTAPLAHTHSNSSNIDGSGAHSSGGGGGGVGGGGGRGGSTHRDDAAYFKGGVGMQQVHSGVSVGGWGREGGGGSGAASWNGKGLDVQQVCVRGGGGWGGRCEGGCVCS